MLCWQYSAKSYWEVGLTVMWMLKKILRGWGMHAADSRTAEEITPSPAKIPFFTLWCNALSQRNEIINWVIIQLSFERSIKEGRIIFQQSSLMYMQWLKNKTSQKQTLHVEATADLPVHLSHFADSHRCVSLYHCELINLYQLMSCSC